MSNDAYLVGLDFGTLSCRAAVVRASDGEVLATADAEYPHAVMDRKLSAGDGQELPSEFALQVAGDYLEALASAVPEAVQAAGIDAAEVIGLGIDFTASTVVAAKADGTPLNEVEGFADRPHAYVKLWKHHGAHEQAKRMVEVAEQRGETWLGRYGGVISSELLVPKVLETLEEDREVYDAADVYIDAGDWTVWQLTGEKTYAAGLAGYKRLYQDGANLSEEYLAELNPDFARVFDKMEGPVIPLGAKAGELNAKGAELTGLPEGIAVAAANIDAHVNAPSAKGVEPGQLVAAMGTSTAMVLSHPELKDVPGAFGVVEGGVVDGQWGYEVGQTAVGDLFAWFVDNCVPVEYSKEAADRGVSVHEVLAEKAAKQAVGEHGLVALDWHNGNRSVLMDPNLSGLIVGLTLHTPPESIYRALIEATAFGVRRIVEAFTSNGIDVTEFIAAGGLIKNAFLMQIYADVLGMDISIATNKENGALGSAIFAATAAGHYDSVAEAAEKMGDKQTAAYTPDADASARYDLLYEQYLALHDHFGRGGSDVMHVLRKLQREARGN